MGKEKRYRGGGNNKGVPLGEGGGDGEAPWDVQWLVD